MKKELQEELEELYQAYLNPPSNIWKEAKKQYYGYMNKENSLETLYNRKCVLEKHTKQWDDRPIETISYNDVLGLITTLESNKHEVLKYIKQVFNLQVDMRTIPSNPASKITFPKKTDRKLQAMTVGEITKLLTYMKEVDHSWFSIFYVTYQFGLRHGEALGIKFSDIDWERNHLFIQRAWKKKEKIWGPPKNGTSRFVPMNSQVREYLLKLYKGKHEDEFILPRIKKWEGGKGAEVLKEIQRHIGIKLTNYHSLRASFITHLLRKGQDIISVQEMVGHKELKTTMGYIRLDGSDLQGCTDKIEMDINIFDDSEQIQENVISFPTTKKSSN
ncbi:tyrosine-type recombinase/integrase [Halobacteriovorax marinus]|nr:site-specific integrase [Halobacteriovorax marinus]